MHQFLGTAAWVIALVAISWAMAHGMQDPPDE
jgi:hypothetical protein